MSKRGSYLGGHTILSGGKWGGKSTIRSGRTKGGRKAEARERTERQYRELEEKPYQVAAERRALRRIAITFSDEVALGCMSSGWLQYNKSLKAKLLSLKGAGITRADETAATLNEIGFKTGSGQRWTPRLINIAKIKLFGLMKHRLVNLETDTPD